MATEEKTPGCFSRFFGPKKEITVITEKNYEEPRPSGPNVLTSSSGMTIRQTLHFASLQSHVMHNNGKPVYIYVGTKGIVIQDMPVEEVATASTDAETIAVDVHQERPSSSVSSASSSSKDRKESSSSRKSDTDVYIPEAERIEQELDTLVSEADEAAEPIELEEGPSIPEEPEIEIQPAEGEPEVIACDFGSGGESGDVVEICQDVVAEAGDASTSDEVAPEVEAPESTDAVVETTEEVVTCEQNEELHSEPPMALEEEAGEVGATEDAPEISAEPEVKKKKKKKASEVEEGENGEVTEKKKKKKKTVEGEEAGEGEEKKKKKKKKTSEVEGEGGDEVVEKKKKKKKKSEAEEGSIAEDVSGTAEEVAVEPEAEANGAEEVFATEIVEDSEPVAVVEEESREEPLENGTAEEPETPKEEVALAEEPATEVEAAEPVSEAVAETKAESTEEVAGEPAAELAEQPAEEPAEEPAAEPAAELAAEPAAEPAEEPAAEPAVEESVEPSPEPAAEAVASPAGDDIPASPVVDVKGEAWSEDEESEEEVDPFFLPKPTKLKY